MGCALPKDGSADILKSKDECRQDVRLSDAWHFKTLVVPLQRNGGLWPNGNCLFRKAAAQPELSCMEQYAEFLGCRQEPTAIQPLALQEVTGVTQLRRMSVGHGAQILYAMASEERSRSDFFDGLFKMIVELDIAFGVLWGVQGLGCGLAIHQQRSWWKRADLRSASWP